MLARSNKNIFVFFGSQQHWVCVKINVSTPGMRVILISYVGQGFVATNHPGGHPSGCLRR